LLRQIAERLAAATHVDPRERLLANLEGPASAEFRMLLERPGRPASVLVPLLERPSGLTVLLTERAAHLKEHAGQVSFPGGRLASAAETPIEAALREATEEVGLPAEHVQVLGCLGVHLTGTGFSVTPVVGFVTERFEPTPDPTEVASVFEVPLRYLLDPGNVAVTYRERLGTRFRTFEIHYQGQRIWGATAAMLVAFRDLIANVATIA
jgi:8-oxo-dGTP pyrophosphatase MutT (NUDIX family)